LKKPITTNTQEDTKMQFTVRGANWSKDVEIENDFSNKYKEKAFEAMSRAVDKITNVDESEYEEMEYGFGPVLFAFEKGFEEDADKQIVTLTEHVLRNCGHHAVAEAFNKKMRMDLKDRISQMNENYNPTDEI